MISDSFMPKELTLSDLNQSSIILIDTSSYVIDISILVLTLLLETIFSRCSS